MRWKDSRRSDNIEDERDSSPPRSAAMGGAGVFSLLFRVVPYLLGTKIGRILLAIGVVGYFGLRMLGIDLMQTGGGSSVVAPRPESRVPVADKNDSLADFVSVVLADTEDTWTTIFQGMNKVYEKPKLVLFRDRVNSACGLADSAMGPFYCPGNRKLYIDLSFYQDMKSKLGAPGDFAQAYVIAHEVGHHVQNLLGINAKVEQASRSLSKNGANGLSVKMELQADCFAGIWGHFAKNERDMIEAGDLEEALNAAAAIGDDRLQEQSQGSVRPESFTHGTSKQRVEWFRRGFDQGKVENCDTFRQSS